MAKAPAEPSSALSVCAQRLHACCSVGPASRPPLAWLTCVCVHRRPRHPPQGQLQGADLDTALAEADGFGTKLCAPLAC